MADDDTPDLSDDTPTLRQRFLRTVRDLGFIRPRDEPLPGTVSGRMVATVPPEASPVEQGTPIPVVFGRMQDPHAGIVFHGGFDHGVEHVIDGNRPPPQPIAGRLVVVEPDDPDMEYMERHTIDGHVERVPIQRRSIIGEEPVLSLDFQQPVQGESIPIDNVLQDPPVGASGVQINDTPIEQFAQGRRAGIEDFQIAQISTLEGHRWRVISNVHAQPRRDFTHREAAENYIALRVQDINRRAFRTALDNATQRFTGEGVPTLSEERAQDVRNMLHGSASPRQGNITVNVSGANNPEGAEAIAQYVQENGQRIARAMQRATLSGQAVHPMDNLRAGLQRAGRALRNTGEVTITEMKGRWNKNGDKLTMDRKKTSSSAPKRRKVDLSDDRKNPSSTDQSALQHVAHEKDRPKSKGTLMLPRKGLFLGEERPHVIQARIEAEARRIAGEKHAASLRALFDQHAPEWQRQFHEHFPIRSDLASLEEHDGDLRWRVLPPPENCAYILLDRDVGTGKNSDGQPRLTVRVLPAQISRNDRIEESVMTMTLPEAKIASLTPQATILLRMRMPYQLADRLGGVGVINLSGRQELRPFAVNHQQIEDLLNDEDATTLYDWRYRDRSVAMFGMRAIYGQHERIVRGINPR